MSASCSYHVQRSSAAPHSTSAYGRRDDDGTLLYALQWEKRNESLIMRGECDFHTPLPGEDKNLRAEKPRSVNSNMAIFPAKPPLSFNFLPDGTGLAVTFCSTYRSIARRWREFLTGHTPAAAYEQCLLDHR